MALPGPLSISYGSIDVNGNQYAVPNAMAFTPFQMLGPQLKGAGYSPPATLPYTTAPTPVNGVAAMASNLSPKLGLILAGSFLVGYLLLRKVHWA